MVNHQCRSIQILVAIKGKCSPFSDTPKRKKSVTKSAASLEAGIQDSIRDLDWGYGAIVNG
jgi:hypothetical protein